MLTKLESDVVATRFMTLKFINTSVARNNIDFTAIEVQDPKFIEALINRIQWLSKNDKQDLIRKEAELCVKNLGQKLHPELMGGAPVCEKCKERLVIVYKHCPKCGVDITKQKWLQGHKQCPKCHAYIEEKWKHCTTCGALLKEEKKETQIKVCPFCGKDVQPEWAVCPYCASKLKLVIQQK